MPERILTALGGNALIRAGQHGTIVEQTTTLRQSLAGVVELVRLGHQLVITHGNGPQVGHGHFLPGSMGPKIEAAIDFLEHGGREVIVTLPELALEAFRSAAGTQIYPD